MDLILGCLKKDHLDLPPSWEHSKKIFSLQGRRELHGYELPFGEILSNYPIDGLPLTLGIKGCNFLEVSLDKSGSSQLMIRNDLYGMRSLFYYESREGLFFCSEIEPLLALLPSKELRINEECIDHYLQWGISKDHETFVAGVHLLPPDSCLHMNPEGFRIEANESDDSLYKDLSIEEAWQKASELLSDSTQKWIEKFQIKAANLSGGADTRLLLAGLKKEQRESFEFITDRSPFLEEDNDKDVLVAKELAKKWSLNHRVREHVVQEVTDDATFFRSDPVSVPKLSGNHGGEILGADVFGAMDFYQRNQEKTSFKERFQNLVSLMFRSFFSDIYNGGVYNHWTLPHRFHARKCAPFWDQRLIMLLSQLPEEKMIYYWSYAEIYRKIYPQYMKTPFFSPIAQHHPDFELIERGVNQKDSVPKKSARELLLLEKDLIIEVNYFDYEKLDNDENEQTIMRSIKVNRWLSFMVKKRKWDL